MEVDTGDPFGSFTSFNLNGFPRDRQPRRKQDPAIHHELRLSLEEVFHGCTKRMKISRRRLNADGRTTRTEDKILSIEIKRGWKEGTKITFPREGDESPGCIPADIVFVIKDKPHPHFRREGSNIVYPVRISLRQVSITSPSVSSLSPKLIAVSAFRYGKQMLTDLRVSSVRVYILYMLSSTGENLGSS